MVLYFAYGSNMDKEDLDIWCKKFSFSPIKFISIKKAILWGFKLTFNYLSPSRGYGAANLMPSKNDHIEGILCEINEEDFKKISGKEGTPYFYEEIKITVEADGKKIENASSFKAVRSREENRHVPPKKSYMDLIINNAKKYGFSPEYIEFLESIETMN